MKVLVCIAVFVSSLVLMVEGFGTGAPAGACDTLSPLPAAHLGAAAQTTPNPYSIDLSPFYYNGSFVYTPGQTYTLSINGTGGEQFRGFLIQARQVSNDDNRVGSFAPVDDLSRLSSCTPATDGVTHNSRVMKDTIYFRFTAPMENTGSIRFGFAVAQERNTYWINDRTAEIQEALVPIAAATIPTPPSTPSLANAQPSPTLIVTPTQSSAGTNLGLYVGVSAGLLVLVLLTGVLIGLGCMGLLTRRRRNKAPHGGIGLVSHKNEDTDVRIMSNENTEPSTETNLAYGELTKSTISDYDYATNPLTVTSDPSTTTRNPAYGGVTREEEVVYTYIESDDKDKEIKQCEEIKGPSYDTVVDQNPAYGDIVKDSDNEYCYVNEGLSDKEAKTGHIDGDKQLQSDPVVDQNAAYGVVEGVGFTTDPPIPTRENQAYLGVNNDSELMDVYDYIII